MRAILGLLGLLVALAVTSLLVRQQMKASQTALPGMQQSGTVSSSGAKTRTLPESGTTTQQSQQIQQQYKQALDIAVQPRLMTDDQP